MIGNLCCCCFEEDPVADVNIAIFFYFVFSGCIGILSYCFWLYILQLNNDMFCTAI